MKYLIDSDWIIDHLDGIRGSLRRRGQSIPDMDLLIAATALERDLTLVTRNRSHFERISDLKLLPDNG